MEDLEEIRNILKFIAREVEASHQLLQEKEMTETTRTLEDAYDRIVLLADLVIERNKKHTRGIKTIERLTEFQQ